MRLLDGITYSMGMGLSRLRELVMDREVWHAADMGSQERWPFHYRGLECKVGSQETPGVTGKMALEYRMKQNKG